MTKLKIITILLIGILYSNLLEAQELTPVRYWSGGHQDITFLTTLDINSYDKLEREGIPLISASSKFQLLFYHKFNGRTLLPEKCNYIMSHFTFSPLNLNFITKSLFMPEKFIFPSNEHLISHGTRFVISRNNKIDSMDVIPDKHYSNSIFYDLYYSRPYTSYQQYSLFNVTLGHQFSWAIAKETNLLGFSVSTFGFYNNIKLKNTKNTDAHVFGVGIKPAIYLSRYTLFIDIKKGFSKNKSENYLEITNNIRFAFGLSINIGDIRLNHSRLDKRKMKTIENDAQTWLDLCVKDRVYPCDCGQGETKIIHEYIYRDTCCNNNFGGTKPLETPTKIKLEENEYNPGKYNEKFEKPENINTFIDEVNSLKKEKGIDYVKNNYSILIVIESEADNSGYRNSFVIEMKNELQNIYNNIESRPGYKLDNLTQHKLDLDNLIKQINASCAKSIKHESLSTLRAYYYTDYIVNLLNEKDIPIFAKVKGKGNTENNKRSSNTTLEMSLIKK